MKTIKLLLSLCIAGFIIYSCEEEKPVANITANEVKNITTFSAECSSEILGNGKVSILSRGVCWGLNQEPTLLDSYTNDSIGYGSFSSQINSLRANTTYYLKPYYISSTDTIYGSQTEFSTPDYVQFNPDLEYGTVTDIDGNEYKTIQIGEQVWMAENLRTTHFQNGDAIEQTTNLLNKTKSAFCYFNNDEKNGDIHGALYNWNAVVDNRIIAPDGWHVATADDWRKLMKFIDPSTNKYKTKDYSALVLRETTTAHWYWDGFTGKFSTNSTGFTSIASGEYFGDFYNLGALSLYWTASYSESTSALYYAILANDLTITETPWPDSGMSIRCIKD